ncbi:OFA family MFS transporter [Pseudonocardia eucalypti]|uniref:OFA family MFS transporter n=1 Tax=Pseudonocardia eucalypti TaxID=648755 RepID=A0ABP9PXW5_9PSEU|nr:MFS family permease [Pseudonocardia eucalypti]
MDEREHDGGREVRDCYGRLYYTRDNPEDRSGRDASVWLAWPPMAAVGVLQYGFGVAAPALMARNGWSLSTVFWLLAGWIVCQAGVGFPVAYLRERNWIGLRAVMLTGAALSTVGVLALAYGPGLLGALVGYSVLGGTGAGLVYAACTSTVAKWHPDRSGSQVSLVTGAFAYGTVPFAIAGVVRLDGINLPRALTATAILVGLIVAGFGLFFRDPPRRWWPAHIDPRQWALKHAPGRRMNPPAIREYSTPGAVHTGTLPVMHLILFTAGAVSLFNAAFLVVFALDTGTPLGLVALAAALLVGINGASRATAMRVSDRLGRRRTLRLVLLVQTAAQLLLALAAGTGSAALLVVAAALAGLGGGAFYPLFASLVRDYFGERRALEVHAVVYSAKALGGLVGVGLAAVAVTAWGFPVVFLAAAGVVLVSAVATSALQRPGLPNTLPGMGSAQARPAG